MRKTFNVSKLKENLRGWSICDDDDDDVISGRKFLEDEDETIDLSFCSTMHYALTVMGN